MTTKQNKEKIKLFYNFIIQKKGEELKGLTGIFWDVQLWEQTGEELFFYLLVQIEEELEELEECQDLEGVNIEKKIQEVIDFQIEELQEIELVGEFFDFFTGWKFQDFEILNLEDFRSWRIQYLEILEDLKNEIIKKTGTK